MSEAKRLIENFLSLSFLQGINIILPLLTFPYIVKTIGVENFGLINYSLSIVMLFGILINFGFNLLGPKIIAKNKNNTNKISKIYSSIIIIKLLFLLVSITLIIMLSYFINDFYLNRNLYIATSGILIGNTIFPVWFFHGMEKMKHITIITFITKIFFTLLIFILVVDKTDYIYIPLLNSLGAIIGGVYGLLVVKFRFNISFILPNLVFIKKLIKDSYYFFISDLSILGGRHLAVTFIGINFSQDLICYFAIANKCYTAISSIPGIIAQTLYPYISRTKDLIKYKKILILSLISFILIQVPILFFSESILLILFDINNKLLSSIFIILISGSIINFFSILLGHPLLGAFGYSEYANKSVLYSSLFYVIIIFITTFYLKNLYLSAISILLQHLIALIIRVYYLKKIRLS